ncbi:MAG: hypothetical protein ACE14P_07430 [Methanotrichaceae archaeon]
MGSKSVVLALALIVCLAIPAFADIPPGPKSIVDQPFPNEDMSGYQITKEVTTGSSTNPSDSDLSFRNESLFLINKKTGMSPNAVGKGVRTPVIVGYPVPIAGVWSLKLTDVGTKSLTLTLFQSEDAIFGSGELTSGSSTTAVTVGGTLLSNDKLGLFVIPAGSPNSIYRLSLTVSPGSMGGNYLYSAPGITQPGVAYGSMIAPLGAVSQPDAQQNIQQYSQYSGQQSQNGSY